MFFKSKFILTLLAISAFSRGSGNELPDANSIKRAEEIQGNFHFQPGMDFISWQKNARNDLIEKLGISKKLFAPRMPLQPKILWERKVKNGTIVKMVIQAEKNYDLPLYVCLPDGKGPFPVWICLQGHGTGMHASISVQWQDEKSFKNDNGDRDFAIQCLAKGYAAICVEQRAFGEKSCMANRKPGCIRLARHAYMFGETLIGNRVFDVDRVIDFIYTRNDLRNDLIGVVGNSGGGTTAIYSGAILERLTHVMPSSCFAAYKKSILAVKHCSCNYFSGMLNWGEMGELAGLCAPKRLVIVNGKDDPIFPIESAKSEFLRTKLIYESAGVPEYCRMVIGNGGHRFYKDDAWPIMEQFMK